MRRVLVLAWLASAAASAQTSVMVPAQTITVPVAAQTIPVPARTVTVTIPASSVTVPASIIQYTVPSYQLTIGGGTATPPPPPVTTVTSNCGLQFGTAVTFCETFDKPAANGVRGGDLDSNVWGVSRAIGGAVNFGQGQYNQWNATQIQKCDGTTPTVVAPHDVIVCNGQLREASNDNNTLLFDNGDVTVLAMYPKQPFDFAGRVGTVSFDVSNDTHSTHAAWPEFWMSDLPIPAPFNHFDSWQSLPANGFGIRLGSEAEPNDQGTCPTGANITKHRWTVDSAAVIRNYVLDDTNGYGPRTVSVKTVDCVVAAADVTQMNHVELRISQSQIDVYASDAGATSLRKIATVTNANLTLTRGLIWLEDAHYNADKGFLPSQRQHTFGWDNVAFDGPFVYRDFSYDAADNTVPGKNGSVNLGKLAQANQFTNWSITGLPANPQATAARILFNFNGGGGANPSAINVTVNGHAHSVPWPYPDQLTNTWRTFAVTVPITDLIAGTNMVLLGANTAQAFSNVNVVLVNVPGGIAVLPGSDNSYPH